MAQVITLNRSASPAYQAVQQYMDAFNAEQQRKLQEQQISQQGQ